MEITVQDDLLTLHQKADYSISYVVLGGAVFFTFVALSANSLMTWLIVISAGLAFSGYNLFRERDLSCTIDRRKGTVVAERGGILGTPHGSQTLQCHLADIRALEMQRYVGRGYDFFQIRFALTNNRYLNLSAANLGFGECHKVAEQIRQFLGPEIPLCAID